MEFKVGDVTSPKSNLEVIDIIIGIKGNRLKLKRICEADKPVRYLNVSIFSFRKHGTIRQDKQNKLIRILYGI